MISGKVTYKQRDLLLTRFPFSDLEHAKVRPVLVVSNDLYNRQAADLIVCAITSSSRPHVYAVEVTDLDLETGHLRSASRVRVDAITAIEQGIILKRIGRMGVARYETTVALLLRLVSVPRKATG